MVFHKIEINIKWKELCKIHKVKMKGNFPGRPSTSLYFNCGSATKMPRNNIQMTTQLPKSFVLLSQPLVKGQYFLTSPELSLDTFEYHMLPKRSQQRLRTWLEILQG